MTPTRCAIKCEQEKPVSSYRSSTPTRYALRCEQENPMSLYRSLVPCWWKFQVRSTSFVVGDFVAGVGFVADPISSSSSNFLVQSYKMRSVTQSEPDRVLTVLWTVSHLVAANSNAITDCKVGYTSNCIVVSSAILSFHPRCTAAVIIHVHNEYVLL